MVNGESEEERSDPLSGLGRSTDVGGVIIFLTEMQIWKTRMEKGHR